MENVILIMPKPSDCYHCHLVTKNEDGMLICPWTKTELSGHDLNIEPSESCPLIQEPPQAVPENSDMSIEWNMGWNACLEYLEEKCNE